MDRLLYSIAYAAKSIELFIGLWQQYSIDAIADVRPVPCSRALYNYHREVLNRHSKAAGIAYVYLGLELGPRSNDKRHYNEQGQVQFDRLMGSPISRSVFLQGVKRLQLGLSKNLNIALMCAEKDALDCHRNLLIGYYLQRQHDMVVRHINHDGDVESQAEVESRLSDLHCVNGDMLFDVSDQNENTEPAWRTHLKLKAYRRS